MRRILFISMLLLFLCVSSFGMAFENYRQGFIIGGLGGIAVNTWKEFNRKDIIIDKRNSIALHIGYRIGGGFKGEKFMIYQWVVMNLFGGWNYDYKDSYLTIIGIGGLGVSYYFKPTSPSLYINSGIGGTIWDFRALGVGAMGGIGYEFTRHWSVECGVVVGAPMGWDFRIEFLAISLSIVRIAY